LFRVGLTACGVMPAMIRPLECFIGLRYLGAGRGRGFVSFKSAVSFLGIGLGVAVLIVILSGMNGLEAESRARLLSLSEHITVTAGSADADLGAVRGTLASADEVVSVTPFVRLEAMLSSGAQLRPAIVRGIDPAAEGLDSDLARVVGPEQLASLAPGSNRILLGRFVALDLMVERGDRVTLWLADVEGGLPRPRRASFVVAGVFGVGSEVHDDNLALVDLADAGRLIGLDGKPQALAVRIEDPMQVARVGRELAGRLGAGFGLSNWAEENRALFRQMAIEKTMMTIVLMFIAGIAAFNIVASLMMVVNEKEKDIAILRTLGLEPYRVRRVFLIQGAVIGVGGTLAGALGGILLAANLETILPWLEQTFGFQIMPGDVYYVSEVPSEIRLQDILLVPGMALVISMLATIYPSRRAARVQPAEVLRYE
jgi:lipoprotein-releasing system permease protein